MIFRFLLMTSLLFASLYANSLKNHQTIILSSNKNLNYAKTFYKKMKKKTDKPLFLLHSDSGYYMVTIGIYSSKKDVYQAKDYLPEKLKKLKPFRGILNYDLTSQDARILHSYNLVKKKISKVKLTEKPKKVMKPQYNTKKLEPAKPQPVQQTKKIEITESPKVDESKFQQMDKIIIEEMLSNPKKFQLINK